MSLTRKQTLAIVAFIGFVLALTAGVFGVNHFLNKNPVPNPHAGSVRVWVDPALRNDQADIDQSLKNLAAVGPAWVRAEDLARSDVSLRAWTSPDHCTALAGNHTIGTRIAEYDTTCAHGSEHRQAIIAHELLHAVGCLHVCRSASDGPDCSPTVVGTRAVLMRAPLVRNTDGDEIAISRPTDLDAREYRRVRPW